MDEPLHCQGHLLGQHSRYQQILQSIETEISRGKKKTDTGNDSIRLLLPQKSLEAQLKGLADGGHDIMRHVPAVEHVDLPDVARVLGNVANDIVVHRIAAGGEGDAGHDVVGNHLRHQRTGTGQRHTWHDLDYRADGNNVSQSL